MARRAFGIVAGELSLVEAEFERQALSNIQVISYISDYLRASGGKRVRPALTLLSNYAAGGDASRHNVVRMATVMEMLHTATLVHDDIIDNAETRRNRASINSRFGNQTAVLMGDWLYMTAFETSLAERSLPVLDILTSVTRKMTEGELIQLMLLGRVDVTEEQYFDVLRRKTPPLQRLLRDRRAARRMRGGGAHGPARLRPAPRHGLPTRGRPSRFYRHGRNAGQGRRRRSARRQSDAPAHLPAGRRRGVAHGHSNVIHDGCYETISRAMLLDAAEHPAH
jgi:hypothetical protein